MPTAKSKIQKLLQELERSEGGGVEAAVAAASTPADFDEILAKLQGAGPSRSDDEDDTTTVTDDTDQNSPTRHRPSRHDDKYLYLERKTMQLMADNRSLATTLELTTRQKDLQIAELQAHLNNVVRDLQERQKDLETRAPLMHLRLEEFRGQLRDLKVSDAKYAELKTMPPASLHALDEVKIAVYEETSALRKENEQLRLAIATARDTAARAEEEAARLRAEHARMSSQLIEKEKDLQQATDSLQARVDRLASELESSMVRSELLAAKGQMYDELKAKADRLLEDNQRLQVIEANFKRLEERNRELELSTRDREHTHELLITDKAYLTQQVDFLQDVQRRLQGELQTKDAKITELQKQRQELFDKLVQTETLKNKNEEAKLQRELAALQATTQTSIERIRVETGEAYEREARLLRQLRDQALDESARANKALTDLQAASEQQQMVAAELQRKLDATILELQGELRHKAFELSHLHVVMGEKESLLQRANVQIEVLQDKLQAALEQYRNLEADVRAAAIAGIPAAAGSAGTMLRLTAGAKETPTNESLVPDSLLADLRTRVKTVEQEKGQLAAQVSSLQAALKTTQSSLQLAGQPHGFLLEQLQAAKQAAQQAEMKSLAATTALKAKEQEAASAASERDALKSDLEALLQQRGQLEGVKSLLMRMLGNPPAGQTSSNLQASQQRAPRPLGKPLTTIIGEGA